MKVSDGLIMRLTPKPWLVLLAFPIMLLSGISAHYFFEWTAFTKLSHVETFSVSECDEIKQLPALTIVFSFLPPKEFGTFPKLSNLISDDASKNEAAITNFLSFAGKSLENRKLMVNTLAQVIDLSDIKQQCLSEDFCRLWRNIVKVFSNLKATETIDLLINGLSCGDLVFHASMSQFPALWALVNIGTPAIPKLTQALSYHENPEVRSLAAICLGEILGKGSHSILEEALAEEKDEAVKLVIQREINTIERGRYGQ